MGTVKACCIQFSITPEKRVPNASSVCSESEVWDSDSAWCVRAQCWAVVVRVCVCVSQLGRRRGAFSTGYLQFQVHLYFGIKVIYLSVYFQLKIYFILTQEYIVNMYQITFSTFNLHVLPTMPWNNSKPNLLPLFAVYYL